mgnify:CR=1 FL=1
MANGNNSNNFGTAIKAKAMNAVHGTVDFIKNPRKVAGLAMAGATLSLVTACGPSSSPETPVSPVPTPSQIDTPTVKPTTEMPTTQETNKGDSCVGQTFSSLGDAISCLVSYGYTDAHPTTTIDADNDGNKDDWLIRSSKQDFVWHGDGVLREYAK